MPTLRLQRPLALGHRPRPGGHGTYVIGHRDVGPATTGTATATSGIVFEDGWQTIDKVLHPERQEFYSSKPPLLPTLVAGEYWLLQARSSAGRSPTATAGWWCGPSC